MKSSANLFGFAAFSSADLKQVPSTAEKTERLFQFLDVCNIWSNPTIFQQASVP